MIANHTLETCVRDFGGARACRVVDAPHSVIREHAHDWPVLSLYVMGSLENVTEAATRAIESPAVVLYGSGAAHANNVGASGFEQIQIEFDLDWVKLGGLEDLRGPRHWFGGEVCLGSRDLARLWCRADIPERRLAEAMRDFLRAAARAPSVPLPPWLGKAARRLKKRSDITTKELAAELSLNPHWLAQAYRAARGEGLRETARRMRVETAVGLLRGTDLGAAEVAADAGFCDQSHMIRCFLEVLGRTPRMVRDEWLPTPC
jgi:AraC family transcriptional regulator